MRILREDCRMCCDEPCLIPDWQAGEYGLKCVNCGTFSK